MLTINDLHDEQELSSFEMAKVTGGEGADIEGLAQAAGDFFAAAGFHDAALIAYNSGKILPQ